MSEANKSARPGRIVSDIRDSVCHIRIDNAARFNAMSMAMWEALAGEVQVADANDDIRAVVLSGEGGKAFASGADISEFEKQRKDAEQSARYSAAVAAAQVALSTCQHPTIAVIRGVCMGGGMALAIACDLRYCQPDSRFRMPAGRLGLGYAVEGMRRMVDIVGAARAADLFFTARVFDGREAERIGLVQEVFAHEAFDAMVDKRIAAVASLAPLTLRAAKLKIRHILDAADAPDRSTVQTAIDRCYGSDDYVEGQRAFMEKRAPRFAGR